MPNIPRPDPNDFRLKVKTPSLALNVKREIILSAIIQATENHTFGQLNLASNPKNQLDKLYRYETITVLEGFAKSCAVAINESNYGKEIVPENEREDSIDFSNKAHKRAPLYRPALLPENTPISLTLLRGFDNWRYSYLHKISIKLSDLSPANFEKIHCLVSDIDEKFQLNSSDDIDIYWIRLLPSRNADARRDGLNFLLNKGIIKQFDFMDMLIGASGRIEIILNIKEFQTFKDEVYKFAQKLPLSQIPAESQTTDDRNKPFKSRKWEEITIQFVDGNNAKITAKNKVVIAHYKEMGFEDARSRKPDKQWLILELLSKNGGEISWDKHEASNTLKKKKQLLAKSLQNYFGIESDPFFPYKEQNSYRLKLNLMAESDRQ